MKHWRKTERTHLRTERPPHPPCSKIGRVNTVKWLHYRKENLLLVLSAWCSKSPLHPNEHLFPKIREIFCYYFIEYFPYLYLVLFLLFLCLCFIDLVFVSQKSFMFYHTLYPYHCLSVLICLLCLQSLIFCLQVDAIC